MSHSVLIVDDSAFARAGLRVVLGGAGLRVVGEAATGEEAVRLAHALAPDVITLDYDLPDGSGIEAARRICAVAPHARVVMLSALGDRQTILRAVQAGAHEFLVKPVDSARLRSAVESALAIP